MEGPTRRIVLALATALGLALLTIAFLLGRLTAKVEPATAAVVPPHAPPAASVEAFPVATPPVHDALAQSPPPAGGVVWPAVSAPAETGGIAAPTAAPPTAATPPPFSGSAIASPQTSVASYFAQVDRFEGMGAGDPQAFANSMMPALSAGDFTAFDDLLAKARAQRQRLQSLTPPPSCVEHHRLAMALSSDSVALLERLKAALVRGDSLALVGIASDGRGLEAKAAQLKAIAEAIPR